MDDKQILERIHALVDEEHELRARRARDEVGTEEETERLRHLEEALDQCWDLLRRRRARSAAGKDADEAEPASIDQVEHYLQ